MNINYRDPNGIKYFNGNTDSQVFWVFHIKNKTQHLLTYLKFLQNNTCLYYVIKHRKTIKLLSPASHLYPRGGLKNSQNYQHFEIKSLQVFQTTLLCFSYKKLSIPYKVCSWKDDICYQ